MNITRTDKILAITKDLPAPQSKATGQAGDDYLENSAQQAQVHNYKKQIDRQVYQLYRLTQKEIEIVEQSERQ